MMIVTLTLGFLGRHITKIVAADQRTSYSDRGHRAQYGFSVEVYRWNREGFRVRLGGGDRFNDTRLDFPTLAFLNLPQYTWLAQERTVLLEVEVEHAGDSQHNSRSMLLLHDFARGDLRTCGLEPVWTFQVQRASGGNASCDELRAFAAKLR